MNKLQELELQEIEGMQEEERKHFVIVDMNGLNWAFRKMAAIKAKMNEVQALAEAERDRINEWEKKECEPLQGHMDFLGYKVQEYHEKVLSEDSKAKSIKTPYGIVKSTTSKPQPEKVDDSVLIRYAKENGLQVVETVFDEKLKWSELKKTLSVQEFNGEMVVVDENGQVVPGVKVKPQTTTFKVEVNE